MMGLLRKTKKTGSGGLAPVKPVRRGEATYRPRGIETVCPEAGNDQERFYLAPAQALGERLRELPMILNAGDDQPTRLQWQFAIAIEAINTLDNYPLQAVVNVHGEDKWDFHRAAYLRALTAGLGEWFRRHQMKSSKGQEIDVFSRDWEAAANLAPVREGTIPVSGGMLEWHICSDLITDHPREYLHPDVYRLFVDSFAGDHHPRNPIAGAVHQAREKMVKRLTAKGIPTHHAVGVAPTRAATPYQSATASGPSGTAQTTPQVEQVQVNEPPTPVREAPADRQAPNQKALKKNGISMQPAPASHPDPEPVAAPALGTPQVVYHGDITVDSLVDMVRQRIGEGILSANQTGAIFHGTPNGPALVVPRGYELIAQVMKVEPEQIQEFVKSRMVDPDLSSPAVTYRLHRQGRGWAKIKLAALTPEAAQRLFPEGLESNKDIKIT